MSSNSLDLRKVKAISDYQFGSSITDILFKNEEAIQIEYSKNTKKIKYIYENEYLLLSFKPTNGFFALSLFAAQKIIKNSQKPYLRAVVLSEISEFIKKGRNVFCKHVVDIDPHLRPLDEVIIVNQEDNLLAVGRLIIPAHYINAFDTGVAIKVRKGIYKSKL
jgi:predicted RNA-binding protein (TIGR00451 family)